MEKITRRKILFLITKGNWGGAQRYVYDLATSLPAEAFDVVVIVGGNGVLIDMLKKAELKVHTLKSLRRDISFLREIHTFITLFGIVRKERPDILHVNSSKAGGLGAVVGRICGVPHIVFTAHAWAFNEDRPHFQRSILKLLQWVTVMLSHVTIAVSYGMKDQMDWIGTQKKMVMVHPGRSVKDMRNKEDARGMIEMKIINTNARLIDYHDDFWIGTIAELHPVKRLNRAIDAVSGLIKEFPNLRFIIMHDGELHEKLQQQVQDLGLEQHVFFTGMVEDAARLLPAFELFVLPSKSEAFGYVLIEAGQANVPVVATSVGGIPDIITNEEHGLLVPPDNTPALAQAMRRMINDEHLRGQLAHALHKKAITFTTERMVADTLRLYYQ